MINSVSVLNYFNQRDRAWILSLIAIVCLIYVPFLGSPFFFDDLSFFNDTNFSGSAAKYYMEAPFRFDLRWLPYASMGRTWAWFGEAPHFYRLINLLLHASSVILLFLLLRKLMRAVLSDATDTIITRSAWFGALIFSCHPVAVYAVGYMVQRSILMAVMFGLIMQLAYLSALLTGQKRWLLLAVIAFVLAGFSREHSVMMPAVLLAMTILLYDKNKLSWKVLWLSWAAFAAVGIVLFLISRGFLTSHVLGAVFEPMGEKSLAQLKLETGVSLHLLSLLTQTGMYFKYLLLWIIPNPAWMSVDMREPFVTGLTDWQGWIGVTGFLAYGVIAYKLLLKRGMAGLAGLALLSPWLMFMVEFSTLRVQEIFVLYRSYLWMPGLMMLVALPVLKWPGRRTLWVYGLIVLLITSFSINRLWVFADGYRLWNDAALLLSSKQVQGADRILYNRGISASASKKPGEAINDLEHSIAMSPNLPPLHFALGVEYFNVDRFEEALQQFNEAIRLDPLDAKSYYAKGVTFKRMHDDRQAIMSMTKSCELKNMSACMIVGMSKTQKR